jgi:class 3 adenylate cyclase
MSEDSADDTERRMWHSYLRHELTAPAAALEAAAASLHAKAEPLGGDFATLGDRIRNRARFTRQTLEDVAAGAGIDRRTLRHDLRGAVGYILSACEELAEGGSQDQLAAVQQALEDTANLARKVMGLVESKVRPDPEREADIREVFEKHRAEVARASCARDRIDPGRILLVDDNEFQRDLLGKMLREAGHTVTTVAGADEAWAKLAGPCDIILCDVLMPGVSGLDFLRAVKSHPTLWAVPVIMVSALEDDEGVLACIQAGAEDYLTRPVKAELLRARIAGSLEMRRMRERERLYQARIDRLACAIFPPAVIEEWRASETIRPRRHDKAGVLFTDIVGFTAWCDARRDQPEQVVNSLQELVGRFEEAARRHGVQKIKTIGDAFMAVAGLSDSSPNPALTLLRFGFDLIAAAADHPAGWKIRIGIHIGPIVSGVLGQTQFTFDVWGHTVNAASRIEANGRPGCVTLSEEAWNAVRSDVEGQAREADAKGLGSMTVWDVAPSIN